MFGFGVRGAMLNLFNGLMVQVLPWVPRALIRPIAMAYVAGETLETMVATVQSLNAEGCQCTVDVLGEFVHTPTEADEAAQIYHDVMDTLTPKNIEATISIKLTQMGLLLDPQRCESRVRKLLDHAQEAKTFVRLDMEDSQCTDATIDLYLRLRQDYTNVGIVLQAYLHRTLDDCRRIMEAGAGDFRICKGIYRESPDIAYADKEQIRQNYLKVLAAMLDGGARVGIATHDEYLVWEAETMVQEKKIPTTQYEYQMLLGVAAPMRQLLVEKGHPVRVYVPFGHNWHAYSLRRFKENPVLAQYVLTNLFKP